VLRENDDEGDMTDTVVYNGSTRTHALLCSSQPVVERIQDCSIIDTNVYLTKVVCKSFSLFHHSLLHRRNLYLYLYDPPSRARLQSDRVAIVATIEGLASELKVETCLQLIDISTLSTSLVSGAVEVSDSGYSIVY
jgi:hypothetical protein